MKKAPQVDKTCGAFWFGNERKGLGYVERWGCCRENFPNGMTIEGENNSEFGRQQMKRMAVRTALIGCPG